jgi:Transposase DDE domain
MKRTGFSGGSRVKNLAEKIAAVGDRRTRCQEMLAELDRTGEDQISLTDPDSRAMAAHTHVAVGYNVQVAVDVKRRLIVEQQVTNQVLDMRLLTGTAEPANEVLGVDQIAVVADRGYFKIEDIEACEWPGWTRICCGLNEGHRSGRACSARTSSDATRKAIPFAARVAGEPANLFVIDPARAMPIATAASDSDTGCSLFLHCSEAIAERTKAASFAKSRESYP